MRPNYWLLPLFVPAITAVAAGQTTWYVDDDGVYDPAPGDPAISDPAERGTLARPFDAIQEAIDAARDGDRIVVLPGEYRGPGNRDIDPAGRRVAIIGQGGPGQTIIDCEGSEETRRRGFRFQSNEGPGTVVRGFTIRNGYHHTGGGIDIVSSPTIRDCVIVACTGTDFYSGGGIRLANDSEALVEDCTIRNNVALSRAGGIAIVGGARPVIRGCNILENHADREGSGIFAKDSDPYITECVIRANAGGNAVQLGFAVGPGGGRATMTHCLIADHQNTAIVAQDTTVLADCIIRDNTSTDMAGGLALAGQPVLVRCVISGNQARRGGGAYITGVDTHVELINCVIRGNHSTDGVGGGVAGFWNGPTIVLAGCELSANEGGHAVFTDFGGTAVVENCTIAGNLSSGTVDVLFSTIASGYAGIGNLAENPRFRDAAAGDYRLRRGSPCIDAGDNAAVSADLMDLDADGNTAEVWPLDIGGLTRFVDIRAVPDTGVRTADIPLIIDMGAHEFQAERLRLPADAQYHP